DDTRLAFIQAQATLFGIARFDRIPTGSVRRVELLRSLLEPWLAGDEAPPDLAAAIEAFTPMARFAGADAGTLAKVLGCDVALLQAVHDSVTLSATPFE